MLSQSELDASSQSTKESTNVSVKGAEYVLDMLGELQAVAELSGHDGLSHDIQAVIEKYGR